MAAVAGPTAKAVATQVLTAAAGAAAAVVLKNVGDGMSKRTRTSTRQVKAIAKRTLTEAAGAATTAGLAVAGQRVAAAVRPGGKTRPAAKRKAAPVISSGRKTGRRSPKSGSKAS
jgi:hypothetical protein